MAARPARKAAAAKPKRAGRLDTYNAKRRFGITCEPAGKTRRGKAGYAYVIQQHDATRMHYDFRLELDGVLLSWAVPKGPSLSVHEKRLAVQTEDHPLDYGDFEGNIPEGEYGGGAVIVWDRGTWTPEGDPRQGMRKGHLDFSLRGEKLEGRFQLVRLRSRGREPASGPKSQWLLMKRSDKHAREGRHAEPTRLLTDSVISGKNVGQMSRTPDAPAPPATDTAATRAHARKTASRGSAKVGRKAASLLASLSPQLALLTESAPASGAGYRFEVKFDGYRLLAAVDHGAAMLRSRNKLDWTRSFPGIAGALAALDVKQAVVDGEICYVDTQGHTDFQKLQNALGMGRSARRGHEHARLGQPVDESQLVYYVFDLLFENGEDLREQPLTERKRRLARLLAGKPASVLRYSDDLEGEPRTILAQACKLGLEGVIGKRADAPYREGRGRDWIKRKCRRRQEFVIVGYSESQARQGFGSLMLGLRTDGRLRYAGRVGTGFDAHAHAEIGRLLKQRVIDQPAFDQPPRERRSVWVEPDLVCEVQYAQMTRDGILRHASFAGLRLDKPAGDVVLESAAPPPGRRRPGSARTPDVADDDTVLGVRISHPQRLMDEESGLSKLQLARYHERVSDLLMREAAGRPLAVVRCPQGDAQQCFFQKHVTPGVGKQIRPVDVDGAPGLVTRQAQGILQLVQFNAMELHAWGSRMPRGGQPDWLIFDLDPDTALGFDRVVEAAFHVREALASLNLPTFVKTTGGKGLHVVVPLKPKAGWDEAKAFCKHVATALAQQYPDRYVANMAKAKRRGKIFIDYLRNGLGATAVLPYSPRARSGAPVALPVDWKQLRGLDPREFRVDNAAQWLKRRRDPWRSLRDSAVLLPDLNKLAQA